ncbi:hypothetical protein [Pontiella desulfatans]|nr:hypothetical protein [Pontiella desulfatans]
MIWWQNNFAAQPPWSAPTASALSVVRAVEESKDGLPWELKAEMTN